MLRKGFTLIEISIVLVIIGLIIGGIIVGKDMIRSAQVRGTIRQVEMFNVMARTFRLKYNGMPGDLLPTQAASFGFFQLQGGANCGDGNGVLTGLATTQSCGDASNWDNTPQGEPLVFWRHLSDANLIDTIYGADLIDRGTPPVTGGAINQTTGNYLPLAKIGGVSFFVFSGLGQNFFGLHAVKAIYTNGSSYIYNVASGAVSTYPSVIAPSTAYSIDIKMDDGMPNAGSVRAMAPVYTPAGNSTPIAGRDAYGIYFPYTGGPVFGYAACVQGSYATTDTYTFANGSGRDSCAMAFTFQ